MRIKRGSTRSVGPDGPNGEPGPPVFEERYLEIPNEIVWAVIALVATFVLWLMFRPTSPQPCWDTPSGYCPPSSAAPRDVATPTDPAPSPTTPPGFATSPAAAGTSAEGWVMSFGSGTPTGS